MADGNQIAQDLQDTFNFKKQRQAVSNAIGKVKSVLGMPDDSRPESEGSAAAKAHADDLQKANDSFKPKSTASATPAAKPAAKPAPKASVPGYKHGTDYVPQTGIAKLHKGEAVLKKEDADHYRAGLHGASDELGGHSKPKKEIKEIRTRKGKSGGYIHEHHHTHPEHHPMEEHTSKDENEMLSHMSEHMGEPDGDEGAGAGASPDMGAAAPPPNIPPAAAAAGM